MPPRFVVSREVDGLCGLLVRETQRRGLNGRLYFKSLTTALSTANWVATATTPMASAAESGLLFDAHHAKTPRISRQDAGDYLTPRRQDAKI